MFSQGIQCVKGRPSGLELDCRVGMHACVCVCIGREGGREGGRLTHSEKT